MSNLKYRLLAIGALVVLSVYALFPRTVIERVNRNGTMVTDTVRRVPLKRGLDLQGGMHLTLAVDESKGAVANKAEALDRAIRVVRNRIDELGVTEPLVQKAGTDRIIVELPGVADPERAQAVVQKAAFLEFQITDETQALERSLPKLDAIAAAKLPTVASAAGTPGATATPSPQQGLGSLLTSGDSAKKDTVKAAGTTGDSAKKPADSANLLKPNAAGAFTKAVQPANIPGQYVVAESDYLRLQSLLDLPEVQSALPPGKVMRWGADTMVVNGQVYRTLWVLDARPIITGEYLTDARPSSDPVEGNTVQFELSREGGRRFQNETAKHIKDFMAVVLDQRVITAPTIESAIGSRGQIRLGGGSLQDAQDLAIVLKAGALPVPLRVEETREVGPSLGQDSIRHGLLAGAVAVTLVIVIMLVYYRFSGLLAVGGLVLYMLYTLATLAGFDATLTLPGLAGFVLSIGIAVDANVLIFERIREELDAGKSVRLAIDEGFRHAMSAIVDSNVSTALTAAVLYQYGTGPVRGFAVTLLAGIAASMITAIFVVRTFYLLWLNRSPRVESLSI
ncbi:SecD export membrane protein [Gemmatirosa kalamazoonensis]|uniref:Protein translocase subunit SecD n=1 Tax=Gemmatirosa kalamazoonensis TaxID=861299 RepID=W0RI20_9BACT|nr:protein translocase subunit SecD [Gemmatirosa kalamazoonensis]AHG90729.1 SecD export membrane protein [Gemmatirosa kalamazoonensis]